MKISRLAPLCGALLLALTSCGCKRLKARDHLNRGVAAYRSAQFQAAINHFKTAVELDPTLLNARLYLATAYFQMYIPGGQSQDNINLGKQAIAAFEDVLKMDPNNVAAVASIAQVYFNMKDFDKAKEYQKRRLEIMPNDPEPYYWIGVIDWAMAYPRAMQVRKDLNLTAPKDLHKPDILPPLPEKARADLEKDNAPLVDEGINALEKAIQLKPNDFDTMAYLNLMYRQKSEYAAGNDARDEDLKQADDWMQKALDVKKQAAAKAATGAQ